MATRPTTTGGSAPQRAMGTGNDLLRSSSNDRGAVQRGPEGSDTAAKTPEVLQEALRRADEAYIAEKDNIRDGRECQKFYAGKDYDQWDEKAKATRNADGRPILQINRLPQFVRQMTGDLRKSPPELKFLPAREGASQEAAEALNGIKRNIDAQSNGKDCYIIATENAAIAGQGGWRLLTEYADEQTFDLDIRKKPLRDPFGFLVDPYTVEPDKSDMKYAFIYTSMGVKDFERQYPGVSASDMPYSVDGAFPWRRGDTVRIAEYWTRDVEKTKLYLVNGVVMPSVPQGMKAEREREVETVSVRYWMITGKDVLSGPHEWAGKYIPLCVVTGEEIIIDAVTYRKGMVHDARDVQRIYNYMRSTAVEAVALQPKSPFIGTVEMFKGHEKTWRTAGSKNHSYLPYNADPKAGPAARPERAQPPIASQGLDTQSAIAASDMEAVIGIYKPALGAPSNETSGIAIARRQQEADTGTFLYPDNLARAIGYEGKILADLIPKIYDQKRVVRILKEDGTADLQTVNGPPEPPEQDPVTGLPKAQKPLIQLTAGQYDVVVTTGPSFASKRAEAAANMVELVRAVPQLAQVAGDLVIKNMDFPGADEIAKRIERTLPPGIKDDGPAQPPPPDPAAMASAAKDAASAHKTEAEAQGQEIQNVQLLMQMHATLQAVQQMLAGGATPAGGLAVPSPSDTGNAPPPAAMSGMEDMPPMMEAPPGEPPMMELPEGVQ